jgi:epoxyqueuosine reductase
MKTKGIQYLSLMAAITEDIKTIARNLGFHKVGIAPAEQPIKSRHLLEWLGKGYQGTMTWMQKYEVLRHNIHEFFPSAKSVICLAHNYYAPEKHNLKKGDAKISRYAWGEDYHKIMRKKLKQLLLDIKKRIPEIQGRVCVDSAPIMEKLWAEQAGIGWQGKNSNLITRDFGSWLFLGELIVDVDLQYDTPGADYCGNCRACMDACPTNAIIKPSLVDSRKCISYLTIEYRDRPISDDLAKKMGNWVFGCDICQEVCPWNKYQQVSDEMRYFPKKENVNPPLTSLIDLDERAYQRRFKKSPVLRCGWKNFNRNVKTVLKYNSK